MAANETSLSTKIENYYLLRETGITIEQCLERSDITRAQRKYNSQANRNNVADGQNTNESMPSPTVCFSEMMAAILDRPYIRKRIMNQMAMDNMPQPTQIILDEIRP